MSAGTIPEISDYAFFVISRATSADVEGTLRIRACDPIPV